MEGEIFYKKKVFEIKKAQSKQLVLVLCFLVALSIIVMASNGPLQEFFENPNHKLATVVNDPPIDTPYINNYLELFNNFSDVDFEPVVADKISSVMKVGNVRDDVKGYTLNNKNYVVHLLHCDENTDSCFFRINGIPTKRIYPFDINEPDKQIVFNIDGDYSIKIKSITFDYCDNRKVCDIYYEAYDVVEVEVGRG